MARAAISATGLSKSYRLGSSFEPYGTLYDVLARGLGRRRDSERRRSDNTFWALRDVDFRIEQGDVVGVIGRNGAGKSTLLKILSRITGPTCGRVEVRGRLASLLEVGTGFHPELSGRENIFLNGAILGMRRAEVQRRFDEIVEFAEIGTFVDTPVKRYSSGMYVRLAFSVAAHLEPDILLVDEVLAVGDAQFQAKCIGKMQQARGQGRTVLVVSHNVGQLQKICRGALWLDRGGVVAFGDFPSVSRAYHDTNGSAQAIWQPADDGDAYFSYREVAVRAASGSVSDSIAASQPFEIRFAFRVAQAQASGRIAFHVADSHGNIVFASANTDGLGHRAQRWQRGEHALACTVPAHLLAPGRYSLTISRPGRDEDAIIENICSFVVDSADSLAAIDGRPGVIAPLLQWKEPA